MDNAIDIKEWNYKYDLRMAPEKALLLSAAYMADKECWDAKLADSQQGCGDHSSDARVYLDMFNKIADVLRQVHGTHISLTPFHLSEEDAEAFDTNQMGEFMVGDGYWTQKKLESNLAKYKGYNQPQYLPDLDVRPYTQEDWDAANSQD